MKKFNLFKEIIIVDKSSLLKAVNSSKVFGISTKGEIKQEPFGEKEILVYKGKHTPPPKSALMPSTPISFTAMLGKNYQVVEDDDRLLIKAFSNWQELIGVNISRASYDDTTGDGVAEFSDKELERIGWHATEFSINYRTLVELLEERCEGTLLCIEQVEPYQFSGLAFLSDNPHAKKVLFEYCQSEIRKIMQEDPLFKKENLSDDELEAAEFFELV
ncbi:MAG: hypothetical protein AUK54_01445 [Helicobacteraceae bacterium CG2_30_36_10]|nr:MAG: hypothetical protein AUK54_01445 [Helicobacteraceae bacterium CG2_30_36_10]